MKFNGAWAAVTRYVVRHYTEAPYPEPGQVIHAVRSYDHPGYVGLDRYTSAAVTKVTAAGEHYIHEDGRTFIAACGRRVKVVGPERFDDGAPNVCPKCLDDLLLERSNESEWTQKWQLIEANQIRKRERERKEDRRYFEQWDADREWAERESSRPAEDVDEDEDDEQSI